MIYFQAVWDVLFQPFHAVVRNEGELARMSRSTIDAVRILAEVLRDVQNGLLSSEELHWKDCIERRREEMNGSSEILTIADYGAQSPMKQLSAQTMYTGRVVQRTVGEVCRSSSKQLKWSLFLFRLIRTIKSRRCLELGTCLGISGAYIGAAMTMNGAGTLVTIEGAAELALRAEKNFTDFGLDNIDTVTGRFQDRLGSVIEKSGPFDAVFIDGHHDGPETLRYFETILPALSPGAIVVFDDIGWSMEMHDAWKTLQRHEHVCSSIDLFDMGVCCIGSSEKEKFTVAV